jgi:hypothetical protein
MVAKQLKEPDGFSEKPLYLSVDCVHTELLNLQQIRNRKERDKFFSKAKQDRTSGPERDIRVIRVDTSGVTIITLEEL